MSSFVEEVSAPFASLSGPGAIVRDSGLISLPGNSPTVSAHAQRQQPAQGRAASLLPLPMLLLAGRQLHAQRQRPAPGSGNKYSTSFGFGETGCPNWGPEPNHEPVRFVDFSTVRRSIGAHRLWSVAFLIYRFQLLEMEYLALSARW